MISSTISGWNTPGLGGYCVGDKKCCTPCSNPQYLNQCECHGIGSLAQSPYLACAYHTCNDDGTLIRKVWHEQRECRINDEDNFSPKKEIIGCKYNCCEERFL